MIRKKQTIKETDVLDGYVRLVESIIISVLEKVSIRSHWAGKKISKRMLSNKLNDLKEIDEWLTHGNAKSWFKIYAAVTGRGTSKKMMETFQTIYAESKKKLDELSTS